MTAWVPYLMGGGQSALPIPPRRWCSDESHRDSSVNLLFPGSFRAPALGVAA